MINGLPVRNSDRLRGCDMECCLETEIVINRSLFILLLPIKRARAGLMLRPIPPLLSQVCPSGMHSLFVMYVFCAEPCCPPITRMRKNPFVPGPWTIIFSIVIVVFVLIVIWLVGLFFYWVDGFYAIGGACRRRDGTVGSMTSAAQ